MPTFISERFWKVDMKLNVDLSSLIEAVDIMGADNVDFDISFDLGELNPIDLQLSGTGIQVDLSEIDFSEGLAKYQERQVLIYIPDHGFNVLDVLSGNKEGRKFHVTYCRTLEEMRAKGRFYRYQATNTLDGKFSITGQDQFSSKDVFGEAELHVCKNCLDKLNYQGYKTNKKEIFNNFSIEEFFSTYSSFFPYMPAGFNKETSGYTNDWSEISARFRAEKNYSCEYCGVCLKSHKALLHVHHVNGIKNDNSRNNLRILCLDCHKKQPSHNHLFVKHDDVITINRLRREQGCSNLKTWDDVEKLADKGFSSLINMCKRYQLSRIPEVGFILDNEVYLDLAWPSIKSAFVISPQYRKKARKKGWKVWSNLDTLEDFILLQSHIR